MHIGGVVSALVAGLVIGLLGRFLAPRRRPLGCLLTLCIGIVGAVAGTAIGMSLHTGFWLTFMFQVVIAALVVTVFSAGPAQR